MQYGQAARHTPLIVPTDLDRIEDRQAYVKRYSWAIPSEEALTAIAAVSRSGVVEVGAGSGYWAQLLRERGVRVEAFDIDPVPLGASSLSAGNPYITWTWGDVFQAPANVTGRYSACTLMLCWPPVGSPMAREALESYRADTLVFIGRIPCADGFDWTNVADIDFFDLLRSEWWMVDEVAIPQWVTAHGPMGDSLTIWRRTKPLLPIDITHGPPRGEFLENLTILGDQPPVTFERQFGGPIKVRLSLLEREDGSGHNWNFHGHIVGTSERVCGFYSTRTQSGCYWLVSS